MLLIKVNMSVAQPFLNNTLKLVHSKIIDTLIITITITQDKYKGQIKRINNTHKKTLIKLMRVLAYAINESN